MLLSLGLALAVTPETRRIYRDPRTLLVLAGAALPILAVRLWLATIDPDLVGRRTMPPGSGLSAERSLQGALVFLTGIPLVFLPWIAFVLFFAWRFPKDAVTAGHAVSGGGDQARKPHRDRDAGADGRAPAVRVCDWRRAVRHQPLRHPLSLPVLLFAALALAGLAAQRVEERAFRAEARASFRSPWLSSSSSSSLRASMSCPRASEATNLLPYARLADELTQARARHSAIRDAVAARRRQSRHLICLRRGRCP